MFAGIGALQRAVELLQKLRDAVEQRLVKEMEPPRDFLRDGGLLQPQLAGHPQKLDFIAQLVDDCGAFARRPARLLELDQQAVDPAMFFEHRHPLGFRRMRRDDRTHPRRGELFAKIFGRNPETRRLRDHIGEGARDRLFAKVPFGLAALGHRRVLLDDRKQLKPDAVRLKDAGERIGRDVLDHRFAGQRRRDLRVMPMRHLEQQLRQDAGDAVAFRGAVAAVDRGGGRAKARVELGFSHGARSEAIAGKPCSSSSGAPSVELGDCGGCHPRRYCMRDAPRKPGNLLQQ